MKRYIVKLVETLSFYSIRGQHYYHKFSPSLRWWWTPWTYRFGYGGWVFLSTKWFMRNINNASNRRA